MQIAPILYDRFNGRILQPKEPTTVEVDGLIELPEGNQKIWRYMTYDKFADLIQSRKLYCRRLDRLSDGLEGLLSTGNCWQRSPQMQAIHNGYSIRENPDQTIFQSALTRGDYFVNCWHINNSESKTMWRLYAPSPESVVVISTAGMLNSYARFCMAIVSKVRYADFNCPRPDWLPWGPALFKDLPYRIEREIRLIVPRGLFPQTNNNSDFLRIPVNATPLIGKVILHPHASLGFRRTVRDLIQRHIPHVPLASSQISNRLW